MQAVAPSAAPTARPRLLLRAARAALGARTLDLRTAICMFGIFCVRACAFLAAFLSLCSSPPPAGRTESFFLLLHSSGAKERERGGRGYLRFVCISSVRWCSGRPAREFRGQQGPVRTNHMRWFVSCPMKCRVCVVEKPAYREREDAAPLPQGSCRSRYGYGSCLADTDWETLGQHRHPIPQDTHA